MKKLNLKENLSQLLRKFIFSNKCGICGKNIADSSIYICEDCKNSIRKKYHLRHRKNIYFSYDYDKEIKKLISDYKFGNRKNIGYFISSLIGNDLRNIIKENNIDTIIPVPISKKRMEDRGFNQVEFLLDILDLDYSKITRRKETEHMYNINNKNLRKLNISSAFYIPFNTTGKNILIVDDIITTGSTAKELIKEIDQRGTPNSISIFSFSASKSFYRNIDTF